jgi:uncharacterized protein (TIRG00374 family)
MSATTSPRLVRRYARSAALLLVAAVSLYLVLPSILSVFGAWRSLDHANWWLVATAVVCEAGSFVCVWQLGRITLGVQSWLLVAEAQLAGTAVARVAPGGGAAGAAVSVEVLATAGVDRGDAAAAQAAQTGLQLGTTLALPLIALPAIAAGAPVRQGLVTAAWLSVVMLVLLTGAGAVVLAYDRPVEAIGRVVQWLLNKTVRRRHLITGLPDALLRQRDEIAGTLGARWKSAVLAAAGSTLLDYLCLLVSLWAVGAGPRASLVLVAYAAGEVLGLVPFTPGGLGFVETGLTGMLALAGVPAASAVTATLLYRLIAYWMPIPLGAVAYLAFRRRGGSPGAVVAEP